MKKLLLASTMVGTLLLSVSCGMGDTANASLSNAKTSAYSVTNSNGYVPGTYSANRVKYYDGLYNTDYTTNNTSNYKDVRNSTDANYLKNTSINTNTMYENDMYKDLSATDFNNGLVTNDHNTDVIYNKNGVNTVNVDKVATNALNYNGGASKTMMTGVYNTTRDINTTRIDETNAVNYEDDNTYEEMKTATKELVDDVATDAKQAVNKAKIETKKAMNDMEY